MCLILNIDTSTEVCSVALAKEGNVIALKENREGMNHAVLLGVFVDELFKENGCCAADLDAVAVSMGPGSYTGLRIGVSLAKGLCYGAHKPLIAVDTLQAMALAAIRRVGEEAFYCPMIDARRMEVYTALYTRAGEPLQEVHAEEIGEHAFEGWLEQQKTYFFGNGSDKVKAVIHHPNAHFLDGIVTSSANMATLSHEKAVKKIVEDIAYFEPFYLKDFVTTVSKKKVIV